MFLAWNRIWKTRPNKYAGPAGTRYARKQQDVLNSDTRLVEFDLLCTGPHVLAVPEAFARAAAEYDYLASINRAREGRNEFEVYPRRLRERLPRIRVPLAENDPDVVLDVQAALAQTYEAGSYRERVNHAAPCGPALSAENQAWATRQVAAALGS